MKKTFLLIFILIFFCSTFITADIITTWGSTGSELSVGGSEILTSFTGDSPPAEIPVTPPVTPPTGGGTTTTTVSSFNLDKGFVSLEMLKGKHYQEEIIITNDGTQDLAIEISITNLEKFIFPEETNFVLKKGEVKTIKFDIYLSEKETADVYLGKINFNSAAISKFVNIVLDVKDRVPLFDIKTTVLEKYVILGKEVLAKISVLNLGNLQNIDVELVSNIQDFDGNTYTSKKESFAVNESHTKEVFLKIPIDLKIGGYVFYSKVSYGNISASSYDTFDVIKTKKIIFSQIILIFLILSIAVIIVIIIIKIKREMGKGAQKAVPSVQVT